MSQFDFSLFDPNTLLPHRGGIAGLALALSDPNLPDDAKMQWHISDDTVSLKWECSDKEALEWLLQQAYQIQDGFLVALALISTMTCLATWMLRRGLTMKMLQPSAGEC